MTLEQLDVKIIPAGMIGLSDDLVAYARAFHEKTPAGQVAPVWVSTVLAMASLAGDASDPIFIPVTDELLSEARRVALEQGEAWATEAIASAEDQGEMFMVSRAFIDEYVALLSSSSMKSIHRLMRLKAVQAMIEVGRSRRTSADGAQPPAFGIGPVPPGEWIPISSRVPAAADANAAGDVMWLRSGIEMPGRVSRGVPVDATHWRSCIIVKPKDSERAHGSDN